MSSTAFAAPATLLVLSFDVTAMGILGVIAVHWLLFAGESQSGRAVLDVHGRCVSACCLRGSA